jgi:hypothetical protein
MNYLKVEGQNDLFRDPNTNSIVNVSMTEYNQYLSRKNLKNSENQKIDNLESDVNGIKNDLDEIKQLLRGLINGSK